MRMPDGKQCTVAKRYFGVLCFELIEKEPTYGYEIVIQLKQLGFSELSESTLYPMLLRLEQQEKVTVERRPSPKGPSRKYYVVTEKGRQSLFDFKKNWNHVVSVGKKYLQGGIEYE